MDVVNYLLDVQDNKGRVDYIPSERMLRILSFWSGFSDLDRPFANGLHLSFRYGEETVKVPVLIIGTEELFRLARANGARGLLKIGKEWR
jgi:hypothetical protein